MVRKPREISGEMFLEHFRKDIFCKGKNPFPTRNVAFPNQDFFLPLASSLHSCYNAPIASGRGEIPHRRYSPQAIWHDQV